MPSIKKFLQKFNGYIYIENIRSFFDITTTEAKALAKKCVKEGLLVKKIGVLCGNKHCGRVMFSMDEDKRLPEIIVCTTCEMEDEEECEFLLEDLKTIEFYIKK